MNIYEKTVEWFKTHDWVPGKWGAERENWDGVDELSYMETLTGACIMGALGLVGHENYMYFNGHASQDPVARLLAEIIFEQYPDWACRYKVWDEELDDCRPAKNIDECDSSPVDICVSFNDDFVQDKETIINVLGKAAARWDEQHGLLNN